VFVLLPLLRQVSWRCSCGAVTLSRFGMMM
jgi:hypothetical protein